MDLTNNNVGRKGSNNGDMIIYIYIYTQYILAT